MMLTKDEILKAQGRIRKVASVFQKKAGALSVLADPTRLKILYLLVHRKELCPSDLSAVLKISISAVSHQLKLLNHFELVSRLKTGKMVCYRISQKGRKILSLTNN